jgi:hypothetical protein
VPPTCPVCNDPKCSYWWNTLCDRELAGLHDRHGTWNDLVTLSNSTEYRRANPLGPNPAAG